MRKDIIKTDREIYRDLITTKDSAIEFAMQQVNKYRELYCSEVCNTQKLQRENGYLKALFDKECDTQVIKYNGKLFRIVSTSHFKDAGEADTIDINAVCVDEVN